MATTEEKVTQDPSTPSADDEDVFDPLPDPSTVTAEEYCRLQEERARKRRDLLEAKQEEEERRKHFEYLEDDEAWGMGSALGTAASHEYYMGYECFSQDIICEDEDSEQVKIWSSFNPTRGPEPTVSDKGFLPPQDEIVAVPKYCDELQMAAVKLMVEKARESSFAAYDKLKERVEGLGFSEAELKRALVYVRDEAPIIIHVGLNQGGRLEKMLADTHYRNQFEVKMSNGSYEEGSHSSRRSWEDRLFNDMYAKAEPFQRPKYGVINIVNDPIGISCATGYGDSYFITKGVRLRTSFTEKDSCNCDASVASCEHYNHVLVKYNDSELRGVMKVANLQEAYEKSGCINEYKEVQLHGEIKFSENISRVVVNEKHRTEKPIIALLDKFCAKNGCTWVFVEDYRKELEAIYLGNEKKLAEARQQQQESAAAAADGVKLKKKSKK